MGSSATFPLTTVFLSRILSFHFTFGVFVAVMQLTLSRVVSRFTFGVIGVVAAGRLALPVLAQGPGLIAVQASYQRAYAVVPMIGKGTVDDPIRPMFVAPALRRVGS